MPEHQSTPFHPYDPTSWPQPVHSLISQNHSHGFFSSRHSELHFNMGIKPVDTIHPVTPPHDPTPSTSLYKATHMVSFQMDLAANIVFCISTWRCHCTPSTPVYTLSPLWPHPHDPNLSICLSVEHKGTHILCLWFEINGMRTLTLWLSFKHCPQVLCDDMNIKLLIWLAGGGLTQKLQKHLLMMKRGVVATYGTPSGPKTGRVLKVDRWQQMPFVEGE